ncbi:MAG: hypothetical protein KKG69_01870 [Alphaproteobacteria bacterium]|nr:hypothetical protein [Alphaproteobacteria bacterium]MBU2230005.1 hypothetical protein [Alphaproteobacteria bacterium]
MGSRKRSQEVGLRSHDANLVVSDLDALSQSAQMIPPIAALFEMKTLACCLGEAPDHCRADCPVAGAIEHGFGPLGVQLGLIANDL